MARFSFCVKRQIRFSTLVQGNKVKWRIDLIRKQIVADQVKVINVCFIIPPLMDTFSLLELRISHFSIHILVL